MLYNAKENQEYICFLNSDTQLPMMHIEDAIKASINLMNADKKDISLNYPYNISSFETSPSKWNKIINSLGYNLNVKYKPDYRQNIADSWPKKIDDSILRNDIKWEPKFNDVNTAKLIIDSI